MDSYDELGHAEVCIKKVHIKNFVDSERLSETLVCGTLALAVTLFWHSLFAHIVGAFFVLGGVLVFLLAWQEKAKETLAQKAHRERTRSAVYYEMRIPAWVSIPVSLITTVAYFVIAQIFFM